MPTRARYARGSDDVHCRIHRTFQTTLDYVVVGRTLSLVESPHSKGQHYYYYYFICHPTIPDESNQTFIRHDDTVLLPGRMHPEHKPTVGS